ncbi:MAG: ATP synthase F1 subunit delta [Chloroflexi bacterium RBG_16_68_14]|nr:MAG: ATP synthase F1 subunit delta [Chloroflexi bacterium RBG_16_68_14]
MLRDLAAKRYAQAAFQLARDRGELEVWERDLGALADAFASAEALAFVSSHQVRTEAKEAFLRRVVGEPAPLIWNLVRLLAAKGRLALLPQIAEQFRALLDEHRGIAHAQVATAVAMSDGERQALARRLSELTGKQVLVEVQEAPEIIGGLIARIGDRLIDGSTRSKLQALKRQLAGTTR